MTSQTDFESTSCGWREASTSYGPVESFEVDSLLSRRVDGT